MRQKLVGLWRKIWDGNTNLNSSQYDDKKNDEEEIVVCKSSQEAGSNARIT